MKYLPALLLLALMSALTPRNEVHASVGPQLYSQAGVQILGPGCTTAFYLDRLCKPCGVGMKSSGTYPVSPAAGWSGTATVNGTTTLVVNSTSSGILGPGATLTGTNIPSTTVIVSGTPGGGTFIMNNSATGSAGPEAVTATAPTSTPSTVAWYTMGNMPDADPLDPVVCTTAQWQNKWIQTTSCVVAFSSCTPAQQNQALVNFINQEKNFTNTANIYYVSLTGNNATALVNRPDLPYASVSPLYTIMSTTVNDFTGTGNIVSGSNVLVMTAVTSGCLLPSERVTAPAGLGTSMYIVAQISGPYCGVGSYLMTGTAASSHVGQVITGGHQPGGVIVIEAGVWPSCTSGTPCLNFGQCPFNGGNLCWQLSGSLTNYVMVMAYPGALVNIIGGDSSGNVFEFPGTYEPFAASCCLVIDGLRMADTSYGFGSQGAIQTTHYSHLTLQNSEIAGYDKISFASSNDTTVQNDVFHDMYSHVVYTDLVTAKCFSLGTAGTDTNFALDQANYLAGTSCGAMYRHRFVGNVVYSSASTNSPGGDAVHINTYIIGSVVTGNIISYSGNPIGLQTGNYDTFVSGNLIFDNNRECFLEYLYNSGIGNATLPPNSNTFTMNSFVPGHPFINTDIFWAVPNIPNGTAITSIPAGGGAGSYTMNNTSTNSATVTQSVMASTAFGGPSTHRWDEFSNNICWMGQPNDEIQGGNPGTAILPFDITTLSYIKNSVLKNNVIVSTNNGSTPMFHFEQDSFPETYALSGNTLFNLGTSPIYMQVDPNSSATIPVGAYTFASGINAYFPGNTNPASTPLPGASESYVNTPGAFSFPNFMN